MQNRHLLLVLAIFSSGSLFAPKSDSSSSLRLQSATSSRIFDPTDLNDDKIVRPDVPFTEVFRPRPKTLRPELPIERELRRTDLNALSRENSFGKNSSTESPMSRRAPITPAASPQARRPESRPLRVPQPDFQGLFWPDQQRAINPALGGQSPYARRGQSPRNASRFAVAAEPEERGVRVPRHVAEHAARSRQSRPKTHVMRPEIGGLHVPRN